MTSTSTDTRPEQGSFFDQPRAVWAVAFACVIAFMGIGLVDPILKPIADELNATPSQVSLLFTSYMAVMGVAMLITGVVSSRIGAKRTLLTGLLLIIVFSALAGSSDTIGGIVGFRAGWGLGNALFIATALSTIVMSARGSTARAIILFEAALGLGIAAGPLLGGELGSISWRAPFYGVAVLMTIALIATAFLLPATPRVGRRTSLADPFRALRYPGLLTLALTALFYNMGFFTLLAFTPFPLDMNAHQVGLVFFGWGILLAITSVWVAPLLQRAIGSVPTMLLALTLFALDLAAMAIWTDSRTVLVVGVIVAGAFLGRQQHRDHRVGDGRGTRRAAGRVRGVLLRPLRRRGHRAVRRRKAGRERQHPRTLLDGCWRGGHRDRRALRRRPPPPRRGGAARAQRDRGPGGAGRRRRLTIATRTVGSCA